jgi:hypothetical protein
VPRLVLVIREGEVPYLPSGKPDRLRIKTLLEASSVEFQPKKV